MRRPARGFTLVEMVIALALASLLLVVAYEILHLLLGGKSRSSLTSIALRSFVQKDARAGVRRLTYRLRESVEILDPPPGRMASHLVFRDGTNREVRLRHLPAERRVISERLQEGNWVEEKEPLQIATRSGEVPVDWPVVLVNCVSIHFTVLSPSAVTVHASIAHEGQIGPLLTVIKLRNSRIAY